MYRVLLLSVVLVTVLAHPKNKCGRFMHPDGLKCCKREFAEMTPPEDIKECMQMPKAPPSCEHDICIANKFGFASTDGTIDKKAYGELIARVFDKDPDLVKTLKEKCIDGDVSMYGPPDFCDIMKSKMCLDMQFVANCPEWDDKGDCSGAKESAEECLKTFPS